MTTKINTTTKQPKVIEFFEIIRKVVISSYVGYGGLLLDISRLNPYVSGKKESINVYEDVRKLANREMDRALGVQGKDIFRKVSHIASLRISYLKGEEVGVLTYEDAIKYVKNFKYYPEIFSDGTLKAAVKNRKLKDFATVKSTFGNESDYYINKGFPVVGEGNRRKTEHKGNWERTVDAHGVDILIPDEYQLSEKNLLTDCLYIEYPYLKKYPIIVYHLDLNNSYSDFYIDMKGESKGSLYIPYKALKDKNPQLIVDRMTSYFESYYKNNAEKKEEALSVLKSKLTKQLFKDIKQG